MKLYDLILCSFLITQSTHGMEQEQISLFDSKDAQLYWAIKNKKNDVVQVMMNSDTEIIANPIRFKWQGETITATSPLEVAMVNNNWDLAKEFIEKGAPFNEQFWNGRIPLEYAAEVGNVELIKLMIDRGLDLEKPYLHHEYKNTLPSLQPWRTVIWWIYCATSYENKKQLRKGLKSIVELGASILAPHRSESFIQHLEHMHDLELAIELAVIAIKYAQEKDQKRLNELLSHDSKAIQTAKKELAIE